MIHCYFEQIIDCVLNLYLGFNIRKARQFFKLNKDTIFIPDNFYVIVDLMETLIVYFVNISDPECCCDN